MLQLPTSGFIALLLVALQFRRKITTRSFFSVCLQRFVCLFQNKTELNWTADRPSTGSIHRITSTRHAHTRTHIHTQVERQTDGQTNPLWEWGHI